MLSRPILLFFLFAAGFGGAAQTGFAPPGAEWCLRGYDGAEETIGYVLARYERDSSVAGVPTKVFSIRARDLTPLGLREGYFAPTELLQQSGDSVFYYVPSVRDRVFLFKDNYARGEVTTTWLYNEYFDVLEVTEEVIDGVPLPVAKLNLLPRLDRDLPVTMYGAIGPDRGFVENWSYFLDGLGGLSLAAYRATDTPEIRIEARSQCFALMEAAPPDRTVVAPEATDCRLVAYPNPVSAATERVALRTTCGEILPGAYQLSIFDAAGRRVGAPRGLRGIPNFFSAGKLPPGRYFAVLTAGEERRTFTFLKTP